jgi:hypothetical protein
MPSATLWPHLPPEQPLPDWHASRRVSNYDEFAKVDVLLVLVGLNWLARDDAGSPRFKEVNDPVRIEIELALQHGLAIIPVRVDGADMPKPSELPDSIVDFCFRNAVSIDQDQDFDVKVEELCRAIELHAGRRTPPDTRVPVEAANETVGPPQAGRIAPTRAAVRKGLAGWIERIAIARGPVELSTLAALAAFMLTVASQIFGLAWLELKMPGGGTKQVGFVSAPNWTIVYLVLFPPYLALFAILITRWHNSLKAFCEQKLVLAPDGSPVPLESVLTAWRSALNRASVILWLLLVVVVVQTISEWVTVCYTPAHSGEGDQSFRRMATTCSDRWRPGWREGAAG